MAGEYNQDMPINVCSALIDSCRQGKIEDVRHILCHYSLSEYPEWCEGYVLICEALKNEEIEVVKLLLQNGAKVNIKRNKRSKTDTPLHYAVSIENMEIIKILLDANADVKAKNKNKRTPLHLAIDQKNEEVIELLLKKGANADFTNKIVQNLINRDADVNFDILKLLIQNGAIVNPNYTTYYTLLQVAINQNSERIVQLLLENGHEIVKGDEEGSTIICDAIEKEETKMDEILLDDDYFINAAGNKVVKTIDKANNEINDNESALRFDILEQKEKQISFKNLNDVQLNKAGNFSEHGGKNLKDICTLLHTALIMKRKEIVKVFLNRGFDVNTKNKFGRTPMYYAYKYNDFDMCKHLLANGACINSKINGNSNLLHVVVENKDEKLVKFLLEEGADINATTYENRTALHIACRKGCERIVKLLLKHNINVHIKDIKGLTPLHEAAKQDNEIIVKLLLRKGSHVNDTSNCMSTPLHFAAQFSQERITQRLLKYGVDVNLKDNKYKTALCYAVESGNIYVVRSLLEKNPDVDDESNKLAFCLAILGNDSEHRNIVEIFLIRGFTIHSEDFNDFTIPEPLYSKYKKDYDKEEYVTIFEGLLKRKKSTKAFFEYQVLRDSVAKGFIKIVRTLLSHDVNMNILLEESCTLFHIAVKNGQFYIAEELLKRGANVDAMDIRGRTSLHVSVLNNFTDVVAFLLKWKINLEARDEDGKTALHLASDGKDHIAKLILDAGANINSESNNKSTPLHIAAESGHKEVVELLLNYDAEIDVKNRSNETPLDLAIYWRRKEVATVLLEHGAKHSVSLFPSYNRDIFEIIITHSIKLQAVSTGIAKMNFYQYYDDFQKKCNAEVEKMVHHFIGMRVSVYEILTREDYIVEMYMRNESIFNFLNFGDFEKTYPIYANMLKVRFNRAKRRTLLIEIVGYSLESMLKIQIPYLVIQKISSYLNNLDLRNLVQAIPTD